MKPPDTFHPEQPDEAWMDAHIDAYLDGELADAEHAAFERGLAEDAAWDADMFLARQIRGGLRTLHAPYCPDYVTESVIAETRRRSRASRLDRLYAWFEGQWQTYGQPALAMAVLLLVVISSALLSRPPQPDVQSAEVEAAMAEVQWTLAYLSEVGRTTGRTVRDEVLEDHIVAPMHDAVSPLLIDPAAN